MGEGTTFPALSALLATWVPLSERSKLGSFVFGGGQIGTILGTALSGLLLDYFEGWESVFYFFGILGILWFIAFVLICYKDPESHPFIKDSEKEFLKREMGSLQRDKTLPPTPWKAIFTSVPMMALVCAQIGHDFGFFIMATDLPKVRFQFEFKNYFNSLNLNILVYERCLEIPNQGEWSLFVSSIRGNVDCLNRLGLRKRLDDF